MKEIDINTWDRKEIFKHYQNVTHPFYMVTFKIDVTLLIKYTHQYSLSFYKALIYLCTTAINRVPAFLKVIKDNKVYEIEKRNPSFTDLHSDSEAFYIVTMEIENSMNEWIQKATQVSNEQKIFIDYEKECGELIYYSCLPWLNLTALTNERDENDPCFKDDSIPRISWGKYVEENGRYMLGISLEVNHRLIDGIHIGKFVYELEKSIEELA